MPELAKMVEQKSRESKATILARTLNNLEKTVGRLGYLIDRIQGGDVGIKASSLKNEMVKEAQPALVDVLGTIDTTLDSLAHKIVTSVDTMRKDLYGTERPPTRAEISNDNEQDGLLERVDLALDMLELAVAVLAAFVDEVTGINAEPSSIQKENRTSSSLGGMLTKLPQRCVEIEEVCAENINRLEEALF